MARRALQTRQMMLDSLVRSLMICSSPKPISRNRPASLGEAQSCLMRTATPALTRVSGHNAQSLSLIRWETDSSAGVIWARAWQSTAPATTRFLPIPPLILLVRSRARLGFQRRRAVDSTHSQCRTKNEQTLTVRTLLFGFFRSLQQTKEGDWPKRTKKNKRNPHQRRPADWLRLGQGSAFWVSTQRTAWRTSAVASLSSNFSLRWLRCTSTVFGLRFS